MRFTHAPAAVSAVFDDPYLVSAAGFVPMLRLAQHAGLGELVQGRHGVVSRMSMTKTSVSVPPIPALGCPWAP